MRQRSSARLPWRFGLIGAAIGFAITDAFGQLVHLRATLRHLGLRLGALLARVLRSLIATAIMALVLTWLRVGWVDFSGEGWVLGGRLLGTAAIGTLVYVIALLGLWIAAGRPQGAETDLLGVAARMTRRAAATCRRVCGGG